LREKRKQQTELEIQRKKEAKFGLKKVDKNGNDSAQVVNPIDLDALNTTERMDHELAP
jgi:hypothetical protein